ncbi:DUF6332 family protein [Streptomyces sp. NBC_00554]|uniref:DUF6332 family protein n=1 Tax=Streptomyces sp. NBC_00554 TaxID=2903661 RepID=UPI00352FC406|nr:DUF6332 family protein [Streptomyces sp. NBC_00554]
MEFTRGRRSQAERDAITVEIGYALCSAAFAAAVVFGAVSGPALLFDLPGAVGKALLASGILLAAALFAVRAVSVLVRFGREDEGTGDEGTGGVGTGGKGEGAGQPSQPGRTKPDS